MISASAQFLLATSWCLTVRYNCLCLLGKQNSRSKTLTNVSNLQKRNEKKGASERRYYEGKTYVSGD